MEENVGSTVPKPRPVQPCWHGAAFPLLACHSILMTPGSVLPSLKMFKAHVSMSKDMGKNHTSKARSMAHDPLNLAPAGLLSRLQGLAKGRPWLPSNTISLHQPSLSLWNYFESRVPPIPTNDLHFPHFQTPPYIKQSVYGTRQNYGGKKSNLDRRYLSLFFP